MADSRFFNVSGPFPLKELAAISGAELADGVNSEQLISDVNALSEAGPNDLGFLDNKKYVEEFSNTKAGACLVHPDLARMAPDGVALLLTNTPYHGYARVAQAFYPATQPLGSQSASASVDPSATIGKNCQIASGAVIGASVDIADNCLIGPNAIISEGVVIGENCHIGAGSAIQCTLIGNRVIIHPGVSIGQDGFGFAMGPQGHIKVPQLGRVVIGDDVEIGANTTIDRGTGPDTVIGQGTKIDNLVQIGHNVVLGNNCIVVSQVGISGSTKFGDFVIIGGQAGFAGHLKIGSGVQVAAQSGIMRNIEPGMKVGGSPAKPIREWFKEIATLERMTKKKGT